LSTWRAPVAFDPRRHKTDEFSSGRPELDRWLSRYAGQNERRSAARTFVVVDHDERVIAFYTLVATEIRVSEATAAAARGMSRHFPIPACRIVRLAVDQAEQGKGLGAALLADALTRTVKAAEQVGIRAIVVDAIDASAAAFYRRFGLESLSDDSLLLMTTVSQVVDAVGLARQPRR
jgi:GNAT superfamily N-acetyltransferase